MAAAGFTAAGTAGFVLGGDIPWNSPAAPYFAVLFFSIVLTLIVGAWFAGRTRHRVPIARRKGSREHAYLRKVFERNRKADAKRIPLAERLAGDPPTDPDAAGGGEGAKAQDGGEETAPERLGEKTRRILGKDDAARTHDPHPDLLERGTAMRARGQYFRMP